MQRTLASLFLGMVLFLGLAACGDDDSDSYVVFTGVYARLLDNKLDYVDSTVTYKGSMDTSTNRFVVRGIPEDA